MATCKHCGKPLILSSGKCIYCGAAEKCSQEYSIQQVNNDTTVHAVDLGLPSGTKWATCNLGAKNPWEYGGYYAWGETHTKSRYCWDNYKFYGGENGMTKYCYIAPRIDIAIDNLKELQPIDDAAASSWGTDWCIPTYDHWRELLDNTKNEWQLRNGVYGRLFISNNGNSLFFPAAGLHSDRFEDSHSGSGFYWCSSLYAGRLSLYNTDDALCCVFNANRIYINEWHRPYGLSIRPILVL